MSPSSHLNALPATGSRKLVGVGRFAIGELCSGAVASDALRPHLLSSGGLPLVLDACEALILGAPPLAPKAVVVQAAVALARLGIGTDARETPLPEAIGAPAPLAIPLMGKSQFPGLKFTVRNT